MARRFLENLAELGLTLAVKLAHDLRAIEMNEVNAAFSGHGARFDWSLLENLDRLAKPAGTKLLIKPVKDAAVFLNDEKSIYIH